MNKNANPAHPSENPRRARQRAEIARSVHRGGVHLAVRLARCHLLEFPADAPMLEDLGLAAAQWGDTAWDAFVTLVADLIHAAVAAESQAA